MATAPEHHKEAERLLALVRASAGDDHHGAADQVPVLIAALVHATLAQNTAIIVTSGYHDPGIAEFTPDPGPQRAR